MQIPLASLIIFSVPIHRALSLSLHVLHTPVESTALNDQSIEMKQYRLDTMNNRTNFCKYRCKQEKNQDLPLCHHTTATVFEVAFFVKSSVYPEVTPKKNAMNIIFLCYNII
jgi:hypothetical protein